MKIVEVRAVTCTLPLSRPIVLGEIRYEARDYLLVEICTDEGISGIGFGNARHAPVAQIVRKNLAPLLLGHDPLLSEVLWERMYYSNLPIGQRGIFMRALSAVDIALWDIKGKAAGMPVWQLLGGFRDRIPALVAGGYPGKGLDALQREVAGYATRGFRMVKIAAENLDQDTARLEAAREAAGGETRLMYDVHWSWRDLAQVLPRVRQWEALDLAWIEDPFPGELSGLTARLRARTSIPLALGEDLAGRWAYRDLLRQGSVDVLRVDATAGGGLSEAMKICALASVEGLPISPHVFAEVHVHLGAALPGVMAVEVTDPAEEINLIHQLFRSSVAIEGGDVLAPRSPGLGVEVDRVALVRFGER
jgi:D-arabinonate dehydratase